MGQMLSNGRYRADDGTTYPSYAAAVQANQSRQRIEQQLSGVGRGIQNFFGGIGRGLSAMDRNAGLMLSGPLPTPPARAAARPTAGNAPFFGPAGAPGQGRPARSRPDRSLGTYSVPGVGTFDSASGRLIQAATRAPAPAAPAVRPAPVAPGMGAPTPVVTGRGNRQERMNEMSQNAGAANISERILPGQDAIDAAGAYAATRGQDPFAAAPALVDQRSQEYSQRADIQAWIEANRNAPKGADGMNIVDRFLAKRRPAAPVQGQLSDAPDYAEGGAPTVPWTAADSPGPAPERGAVIGEKFYGKTWDGSRWIDESTLATAPTQAGWQAAIPPEPSSVAPRPTAQDSNLNFNSPMPAANAAQALKDEVSQELLDEYRLNLGGFPWNRGI